MFYASLKKMRLLFLSNLSVKQTIFKNTFWLTMTMALNSIVSVFISIWIARSFGPVEYGKWGFILSFYTKRFDLVCILTTLTHMARGEKFTTDLNYVYKWSTEFCSRIGLELSPRLAGTIVLSGLMIVSVQFLII